MPFNCPAEYLLSSLRVGSLALKFTDETRITPLEHDGFTASHPGIPHPTTARVFKDKLQPLGDDPGWLEAPSTIKSVIHHVSNGWSGYSIRNGSPWISTTGSFEWAVWEIVRRLDVMKRNAVYLTVVSRQEGHSRNYQGVRHITLDAAEAIDEYCDLNCRGGRHGVDHKRAHDFATSSQEMLFYGRIFRKDIVDTTTWDNEVCIRASHLPRHADRYRF